MSTYAKKLMAAMVVSGLSVGMMSGAAQACGVKINITGETTIQAGANPLALGAKTSDCKQAAFQWKVKGVGSVDEPTEQAIFYTPPSSVDGNKQVTITVRVTEKDGNEASDNVTLTIVGGDIPPTPTPEPTPTPTEQPDDCTAITVDGEVMEFGISGHKEASWRGWSHFVEAIKLLKNYNSSEGLVREYHEEREILFRFQLERGHPLYELQLAEAEIQIGSCWKEVKQLPGYTYTFQGTEGRVRKVTVYVLDKK